MKKTSGTKRALFTSIIALLLCMSMLVGTTFAWFTDEVVSGNNTIIAGNLDVELKYASAPDGTYTSVEGKGDLFVAPAGSTKGLWEPGHTEVAYLEVHNAGTLHLQYNLAVSPFSEVVGKSVKDADGNEKEIKLSEILKFAATEPSETAPAAFTRETAQAAAAQSGVKLSEYQKINVSLAPGASHYIALVVYMPESVGNEANYRGDAVPTIDFGVTLLATQEIEEYDSFGKDYDDQATYPKKVDTWDGTADTSWYNDTDTVFELKTAEQLAGLAGLVDDGNNFAGKTIKLTQDYDLAKVPFNPIGHSANGKSFNGTFDGQGHTISNMYEQSDLGAWQYEGEYYGLFAYTNGATIKNVTIADAYISSGRNEAAGVVGNAENTTFSDITISNTTLIAYNNSAGGVAAECYGDCSFTNITVDEETVIGPLWGTYDVRLGGVVGLVHAGNNVTFSNITVACQLDAINDVAANYQYWLYRYSGMLIGHVDGVNGVADPTGYVTCENVKVIYDDWVNYHYCEDADLGAGSYNGPGEYKYARVEAGTGTDGIDLSACDHNDDESHNVLIVFDQLFGGGQGIKGLATYDGVEVIYNK